MKRALIIIAASLAIISCRTVRDIEKSGLEETRRIDDGMEDIAYAEPGTDASEADRTVVYVEAPEVLRSEETRPGKALEGADALKQYLKDKTVVPEYTDNRLKAWVYQEERIYEVHAQTYHTTIIQLEPGEQMIEVPYISEPDVWRISRGSGMKDGKDVQYLMIKPDYSGQTSTLIVITNRRLYQMLLRSYKDHYMPYVKWVYNRTVEDSASWTAAENRKQDAAAAGGVKLNLSLMSDDYLIKYSRRRKPAWCPKFVCDDGQKTYIVLDEKSLNMEAPAVFKKSNSLVNYRTDKNIIILDELIEKVTLKLGTQKVVVTKKKAGK